MPVEKFYPSAAVEGDPSEVLEVCWSKDEEGEGYENVWIIASDGNDDIAWGLAFDLDRSGLNRLIKALRRARNAAFGGDE